jgi:hypothetical protein
MKARKHGDALSRGLDFDLSSVDRPAALGGIIRFEV